MTVKGARSFDTAFSVWIEPAPQDFDELSHVNNAVYLRWAQEIAVQHWRAAAGEDLRRCWLWVVLRHEIDYRDPILPGDRVEARTWLGKADGARFDRFVDLRRPGAPRAAAAVRSTWVMIDAVTRKPRRVSEAVLSAFGVAR